MADNQVPYMPRGQVSVGSGTLQFATTASFTADNGAKLKHSLRRSPCGYTKGVNEISGKIELDISEDGPERDFWQMYKDGKPVEFIFEIPNDDRTLNCVTKTIATDFPNDDSVHQSIDFIAWL